MRYRLEIVLCIILAIVVIIYVSSSGTAPGASPPSQTLGATYIPTVKELQLALCAAGYEVEVDCVIGKETKRAWERFCADREAMKYMTPSGGMEKE